MKPKLDTALLVAVLAFMVGAALIGCGKAAQVTTPTTLPPAPPKKLVVVAVTGVQNGAQGVDTVAQNSDFKINATASRCYLDEVQVPCDSDQFAIPYWRQRQTGGGICPPKGDINSSSVQYSCPDVGPGHAFEACALDFDKSEIGCGPWIVEVR